MDVVRMRFGMISSMLDLSYGLFVRLRLAWFLERNVLIHITRSQNIHSGPIRPNEIIQKHLNIRTIHPPPIHTIHRSNSNVWQRDVDPSICLRKK